MLIDLADDVPENTLGPRDGGAGAGESARGRPADRDRRGREWIQ
jgi:hypothetical protein